MRILFASTQGAGHFGPLIPFIEACTRSNHEILIVGPPTLKARGYPFRAGAVPPDELLGPVWGRCPCFRRDREMWSSWASSSPG